MLFSQESIVSSCKGRSWLVRLPVVAFLIYLLYSFATNPDHYGILDNFNLLMHEAGHLFLMPFGRTLSLLGGTIFQLLIPVICVIAFLREQNYFGFSFAIGWLGESMMNVARYIADARARVLPLLGGDPDSHDWYNLLSDWGMLQQDLLIAQIVKMTGGFFLISAIMFSGYLLWLMHKHRNEPNFQTGL